MIVSAIVAADTNNAIGRHNAIPWYLSADLKFFKATTLNHHVIMGRKSFESIGRPLPKRTNIVITRDPFYAASGALVVHSLDEALNLAYDNGETEAFVIGGGEIYRQALPSLDRIYLTVVNTAVEHADTYFPVLDPAEWTVVSEEHHEADEKNEFDFVIKILERAGR